MQTAHQTAGHACANPHCDRLAQHGQLACRGCWFALPKLLRDNIWATWRASNRREHGEYVRQARDAWTVQRFEQLARFRNDGASMSEAQFQQHLNDTPGFRAWCEREGVPT